MEITQSRPLETLEAELTRLQKVSEAIDDDRVRGMRLLESMMIASEAELSNRIANLRKQVVALSSRQWVGRHGKEEKGNA